MSTIKTQDHTPSRQTAVSPTGPAAVPKEAEEAFRHEFNRPDHGERETKGAPSEGAPAAAQEEKNETLALNTYAAPSEGALADALEEQKETDKTDRLDDLSSLMGRLFSERLGNSPPAVNPALSGVSDVVGAEKMEAMEKTLDHLVKQILVSQPEAAGDHEVRLMLNESILPDTEIRLARGADGFLSVTLVAGQDGAFQTLVAAQGDLRERLAAHETQEVRVTVTDGRTSNNPDDASSGRRSATYRDYQGEGDEQ